MLNLLGCSICIRKFVQKEKEDYTASSGSSTEHFSICSVPEDGNCWIYSVFVSSLSLIDAYCPPFLSAQSIRESIPVFSLNLIC